VKGFLLDTNVPSELTRPRSAPQVERWLNEADNEQLFFSVISLAEICKGIAKLPESRKRAQLQDWLDFVLRPWFTGRILPITEGIAERMGRWAGEGEAVGRVIKIADGLIAATASEHDLTLVTRNVRDFAAFGVPILNPWDVPA
jgi:predicted nucleic acid-binding protein